MIENGKKSYAVKNFTLAGNFFELLKSVKALSDIVDLGELGGYTVFGSPAALFENMSVAGE
jgi:PmbA protein